MTLEEALDVIEKHHGRLQCDHKSPELDEETGEDCLFLVTLFLPPAFWMGASAGGDTIVKATEEALRRLEAMEKRVANRKAREEAT